WPMSPGIGKQPHGRRSAPPQEPNPMIACDTPDFLHREPEARYRQHAQQHLSSHALADFRRCPLLFHRKRIGLIADEDSNAFLLGRAAHTRILEGREVYERSFAIGGPINEKTGKPFGRDTKAFAEWTIACGKPVLSFDQAALIESLAG